jgi:hypothetical protein
MTGSEFCDKCLHWGSAAPVQLEFNNSFGNWLLPHVFEYPVFMALQSCEALAVECQVVIASDFREIALE